MIQLQPRDYQVLRLCYEHQFVTTQAIQSLFERESYRATVQRLNELTAAGLLAPSKSQVLGSQNLFRLTSKSKRIAEEIEGEKVSQSRSLNLATLFHDNLVIEVRNRLLKKWNASFICERLIKQEDFKEIPDGLFVFESRRVIALEIENSDKGRSRFESLLCRWDHIQGVHFVLYLASSSKLGECIKRYVGASLTKQPVGVLTIDELRAGVSSVWTVKGPLALLDRSPF